MISHVLVSNKILSFYDTVTGWHKKFCFGILFTKMLQNCRPAPKKSVDSLEELVYLVKNMIDFQTRI
jgi:SNF family Na+-dependent transporter